MKPFIFAVNIVQCTTPPLYLLTMYIIVFFLDICLYTMYSPTEIDLLKLKITLLNSPDFEGNIFCSFQKSYEHSTRCISAQGRRHQYTCIEIYI